MQLKGLKIVHLSCTRVSLVVFVVSFFYCIVTSASNHGYTCYLTEVVHVFFKTKIVIPFIVLVESCYGAKICEHNSVMERGPKWVKLNRLTISHSTVWI
jgi:hypothetical protein